MKLYKKRKIAAPEVTLVDIYHDPWCQIYKGGYCNCHPIIKRRTAWPDTRKN
jgi:hypothetical protein